MTFLLGTWLQAMKRKPAPATRTRREATRTRATRFVPRLETLDDRIVPSTLTVTNNFDTGAFGDGSLRGEIAAAQSGDTINFAPSLLGQTVTLTNGELAITKNLDIEGPGANQLTISGNNASRVFDISGSTTVVAIDNLTIADGLATGTTAVGTFGPVTLGGGILNTGAHVTLSGVALVDNQALAAQVGYVQTNLVSDIPGLAQLTDPNLKNPWGTAHGADGSFSVSDQQANVSTLYSVTAAGVSEVPPTVAIPTTAAPQGPTGQVNNDTSAFLVNGAPASFIYADLNGTISAWNSSTGTMAKVEATTTGAVYTGLDLQSTASGDFLYAANPKQGRIDVFDGSFNKVTLPAGAFVNPQLPPGLVPFSVDDINGDLYVMYAPAGPPTARNMVLEGHGAVAVFDTSGHFIKQLISGSGSKLASPWGIVLAPSSFGKFGGDLLVGNFSYAASEINAFDPVSGTYLGTLTDSSGNALLKDANGLWDLTFGIGGNGGDRNTLYFVTGLNAETDGLFGAIDPVSSITEGGAIANVSGATLNVSHGTFTDNRSTGAIQGRAGALANDLGSTVVLDHSTFAGNEATTLLGAGLLPIQGNALGGALINVSGSRATVSYSTFEGNSAHGGNGADGGPGQNGGNAGTGAGGAVTNDGGSSLGPFAPSTMTVEDSLFLENRAIGGNGGNGGAGGNGGNGSGLGAGPGAINNGSSTLTVSHSRFIGNESIGGNGGNGGVGGNGGAGSAGAGGAISSVPTPSFGSGLPPVRATLHVSDSLFLGNEAIGGVGGNGGSGGNGGNGGAGQGGALRLVLTDWDVSDSLFILNQATGGAGGAEGSGGLLGGNGGAGQGGGLINLNGSVGAVSDSVFVLNAATGGAGGVGGNGGNGQGGGVFNDATSSLTLQHSRIVNNAATGGAAGSGGSNGEGIGGGLYLTPGGVACADLLTVIFGNHATTSDDDVFGDLVPC